MATEPLLRREERDLLIELKTEMAAVRNDIREIKDNTAARLAAVEQQKLDRTEATRLQTEVLERTNALQETNNDHEVRIRDLERYLFLGLGGLTIITFFLNYFHPFVK